MIGRNRRLVSPWSGRTGFLRAVLAHGALILAALLVCLAGLEVVLRLAAPQYKYAAMARHVANRTRIFANAPGTSKLYQAPDSDRKHLVRYNSLGMRQSRDVAREKSPGVRRVAFLGDSFTANLRMPVEYGFAEPLDYLLNASGIPAEVLNFGVDGYGPDQEYLQLVDDVLPLGPDMVCYVYCANDIRNVLENNLFELDGSGALRYKPHDTSFLKQHLKDFYLTYLVLDAAARLGLRGESALLGPSDSFVRRLKQEMFGNLESNRYLDVETDFALGRATPLTRKAEALFLALLGRMREACQAAGAGFSVVLVPGENRAIAALLADRGFDVLDLNPDFDRYRARSAQPTRFAKDGHWNEEGNKVAALALFRFVAGKLGRTGPDEAGRLLGAYYGAFPDSRVSRDGLEDGTVDPAGQEAIRRKYADRMP